MVLENIHTSVIDCQLFVALEDFKWVKEPGEVELFGNWQIPRPFGLLLLVAANGSFPPWALGFSRPVKSLALSVSLYAWAHLIGMSSLENPIDDIH